MEGPTVERWADGVAGEHGFTDGSFDSISYDSDSDTDIASFTLQLDNGEEFLLLVYVLPDGTVCDFI